MEHQKWENHKASQASLRFDQYLGEIFSEHTRSSIQKLIKEGRALLDKKKVKPSTPVKEGMLVSISLEETLKDKELEQENIELDILYEDEDIVVVNKKAGMVVHPAQGNWNGTMVNALLYHCQGKLAKIEGEELRPGVVHRIDKNTSGVLVAAKTKIAKESLMEQFKSHTISRVYRGICWGILPEKGTWQDTIGRDPKKRQRMAVKEGGRSAITNYKRLSNFSLASYFEASLETGRTHQIRVHFSHNGYPVLGDSIYSNSKPSLRKIRDNSLKKMKESDASVAKFLSSMYEKQRQALHAYKLGIVHPRTKEHCSFIADIPEDIQKIIEQFSSLG